MQTKLKKSEIWIGCISLFCIVLLLSGIWYTMAETISTIKPGGGGDYLTLIAWEADKGGDITAGNAEVAEVYADITESTAALCVLAGWTTDADSYIAIRNEPASPRSSANPLRAGQSISLITDNATGRRVISIGAGAEFTRISGMDLIEDASSGPDQILEVNLAASTTVADIRIFDCIIASIGSADAPQGIEYRETSDVTAHVLTVYNCLIYNCVDGVFTTNAGSDHILTMYNCTIFGCSDDGIDHNQGTMNCYNTISYNNTGSDFEGTIGGDYNMSEDATAPGANSVDSGTGGNSPVFVNTGAGTEDFHLQVTSDAIDLGQGDADGGGEPSATFAVDIDGITRGPADADWDMGASEFVAAAAGVEIFRRRIEGY